MFHLGGMDGVVLAVGDAEEARVLVNDTIRATNEHRTLGTFSLAHLLRFAVRLIRRVDGVVLAVGDVQMAGVLIDLTVSATDRKVTFRTFFIAIVADAKANTQTTQK